MECSNIRIQSFETFNLRLLYKQESKTNLEKIVREMVIADDSRMSSDTTIASKWKQWKREQKLVFGQSFKKHGNKNRVPREFQSHYKVELNSRTFKH